MRAIRAASAFDGERFLDGGVTVLVDDERIVGVEGPQHEPPEDCAVTTYAGTLLPGLVDTHVHLVADASLGSLERSPRLSDTELDAVIDETLLRHAVAGVTTVRDLGDCRFRTLEARDRSATGRPRVVCAGPPLTVPRGHCHYLGGVVSGEAAVADAVRERAERGVDVVKVMASGGMLTPDSDIMGVQFTAGELAAAVRTAHEVGLGVVAHAHSLAAAWHALGAGVDGLEHFTCLTDEGMTTPPELLDRLAERAVVVSPTIGNDPARIPPLAALPPQIRELVDQLGLGPSDARRARAEQLSAARARGVLIVTGTDAGVGPSKDHGILWRAVLQLLESDFPLAEALATATSRAAEACGVATETGRLRAGLAADLLVTDGDLQADPTALGRPAAVLMRGVAVALAPVSGGPAPVPG